MARCGEGGIVGDLTMLCELHVQEWLCLIILLMYAAKHCIHSVGLIQMCWNLTYIVSVNRNVITGRLDYMKSIFCCSVM